MFESFKVVPFGISNASSKWVLVVDGLFGFFETESHAIEVFERIGDIDESPFGNAQLIPPKYIRINRFTKQPEAHDTITRDDDRAIDVENYVALKRMIHGKFDLAMFGPKSQLNDQEMGVNLIQREKEVESMTERLIDDRKFHRAHADICNGRHSANKDWICAVLDAIADPLNAKRSPNLNPACVFDHFSEIDGRTAEELELCKRVAKIRQKRNLQLMRRQKALQDILDASGFDGAPC
jgi:hypothetical protein